MTTLRELMSVIWTVYVIPRSSPTTIRQRQNQRDLNVIKRVLLTFLILMCLFGPASALILMKVIVGYWPLITYRIIWLFLTPSCALLNVLLICFQRLYTQLLKEFRTRRVQPATAALSPSNDLKNFLLEKFRVTCSSNKIRTNELDKTGITSYGHADCAGKDKPTIYIRVTAYFDWICNVTNNTAAQCRQSDTITTRTTDADLTGQTTTGSMVWISIYSIYYIGIGGVLTQKYDGNDRPIAYMFKTINRQQRKWSTTERECFAILEALKL
ncbi:unnamed protein product [Didymodactylos carnosus]|uniref:Reverse transcriptase RNase H-like domain-containing protein n=1 Tax=Didymodactylos carnosus TaxID=1234261 RepID=A0A814PCB0_9BILA|nr:unnamed protein product [Didymodactylos carnosus]CAF3870611.1 unnamed protein product [Didymodactylos carnosus]